MTLQKHRSATLVIAVHDRKWWAERWLGTARAVMITHSRSGSLTASAVRSPLGMSASVFNYKKLGFKHLGSLHYAQCDPVSGEIFDTLIFEMFAPTGKSRDSVMREAANLEARKTVANALKSSLDAIRSDASVESLPQWDTPAMSTLFSKSRPI